MPKEAKDLYSENYGTLTKETYLFLEKHFLLYLRKKGLSFELNPSCLHVSFFIDPKEVNHVHVQCFSLEDVPHSVAYPNVWQWYIGE